MFSLVVFSKSKFFTCVAIRSFVSHSCRIRVVRVSDLPNWLPIVLSISGTAVLKENIHWYKGEFLWSLCKRFHKIQIKSFIKLFSKLKHCIFMKRCMVFFVISKGNYLQQFIKNLENDFKNVSENASE